MRQLECRDLGFDCDAVVQGESDDAVLVQVVPHAEQVHGVEVTPELATMAGSKIRDV